MFYSTDKFHINFPPRFRTFFLWFFPPAHPNKQQLSWYFANELWWAERARQGFFQHVSPMNLRGSKGMYFIDRDVSNLEGLWQSGLWLDGVSARHLLKALSWRCFGSKPFRETFVPRASFLKQNSLQLAVLLHLRDDHSQRYSGGAFWWWRLSHIFCVCVCVFSGAHFRTCFDLFWRNANARQFYVEGNFVHRQGAPWRTPRKCI